MLAELRNKDLPNNVVASVNDQVDTLNVMLIIDKAFNKQLKRSQASILKQIEKELKLVPKNHYRNAWLAIGMSAFGLPLGIAFGGSFDNMSFIGIGLPIGMAIGIAVGSALDKKASENGNQLNMEINY